MKFKELFTEKKIDKSIQMYFDDMIDKNGDVPWTAKEEDIMWKMISRKYGYKIKGDEDSTELSDKLMELGINHDSLDAAGM